MKQLTTASGNFSLERLPNTIKGDLRAWDAADELLLKYFFEHLEEKVDSSSPPILVINDAFGALSIGLNKHEVHNWSDSYLSHLALKHNVRLNQLNSQTLIIPSSKNLNQAYKLVLIKIPKTLSLLEDQLCRLKPLLPADAIIVASAMSKHIHTTTLKLFGKIIGTTVTSRATKKARLVFVTNNQINHSPSPYPKTIFDKALNLKLVNHANVFSKDRLDIGTRFMIEQLQHSPKSDTIIDLGCGNGALGLMVKRLQVNAHISFIDESYMAIESSKRNWQNEKFAMNEASFHISDGLSQYNGKKAQLILCNPPFHQAHSIGDQIAWNMFQQSLKHLSQNGELWVIGNRHLAYHTKLKRLFGNCVTLANNKKFVILKAKKV